MPVGSEFLYRFLRFLSLNLELVLSVIGFVLILLFVPETKALRYESFLSLPSFDTHEYPRNQS